MVRLQEQNNSGHKRRERKVQRTKAGGRRPSRMVVAIVATIFLVSCGGGEQGTEPLTQSATASRKQTLAINPDAWVTVPAQADPLLQGLSIPADAPTRGMWSSVKSWPLNALHAAVLPNGKVLTFGTTLDGNSQNGRYLDVWDPTVGFTSAGHRTTFRATQQDSFCAAATYLPDGRLMISGGNGAVTSTMYAPASDSVTTDGANLADQRWYGTMITLSDGRPLMLGGMAPYSEGMQNNPDTAIAQGLPSMTPEVYENGAWRSLPGGYSRDAFGPDYLRTSYPRAWVAPDGRVFGISAERMWVLDPAGNGSITTVGAFKTAPSATTRPNVGATNSAVMFAPGRILVVGGNGSFNADALPASNAATLVDINSGVPGLNEQPAMTHARRYPNTIVLPDGTVLVTGGSTYGNNNGANAVYAAEMWNPATGAWTVGANAAIYRGYHSFTVLLPNGTVLSTGGGTPGPVTNLNAEVYYPPQLFRTVSGTAQLAPRPMMTAISGLSYASGAPLQIDMADAGAVAQLVLIGVGNGTHSFNPGQRRVPLTFTQESIRLTTTLPDANTAPPGYYQLIAIDAAGVPSRGVIVAVGAGVSAPPVTTTPYDPPEINAPINAPILVAGGTASYTVSAASGTTYSWDFGDGSAPSAFSANPAVTHQFAQAGLYTVTLTARAADGSLARRTFVQAVSAPATARAPTASSAVALETRAGASARLWVVNPDTDTVAVIDTATNTRVAEIAVGKSPRSVAIAPDGRAWVTNKGAATISVINAGTLTVVQTFTLARASQPHGLAFVPGGSSAFVVLEATGELLKLSSTSGAQQGVLPVGLNPRHVSISADGATVLVSRFITPPLPGESTVAIDTSAGGGEVIAVDAAAMTVRKVIVLAHSDKADSEIQGSGVPNYLAAAVISPDGASAWVPSKQDNVKRGALRDGRNLDFQNTVRAISSRIEMTGLTEELARRVDHDNSSVGSAAAFHPSGAYLFVALETSRQVAVVDARNGVELFKLDVGRAPQGLATSADGRTLYVQNFMDRSVSVIDLAPLVENGELRAVSGAPITTVGIEKLTAQVLLGKRLFYDARDPRLARDSYMSCASCHNDGGHDGRVWDLTGVGEGLRNTIALRGRASMGQGLLHWSANFDELQDFEKQIRDLAGGTGLMSDAAYNTGTRNQPLGTAKAGVSSDLDALAAYVASLDAFDASPSRPSATTLSAAATAGKTVFQNANCASCHGGTAFTTSSLSLNLRNIGTIKPSSGTRLGGTLTGIDVPTLRDVWATAPYLHDGSAATLAAAVQAHAGNAVAGTDLSNLVTYLQQIGGEEPGPVTNAAPTVSITAPAAGATIAVGQALTIAANAADGDGSIARVDFYVGATLIGSDTTAPYSVSWTPGVAGTYSLSARAIDNSGATTTSAIVTVTASAIATGTGLSGSYYATNNLSGSVVLSRTEAVNFNWGSGSPGSGVPSNNFSARWTGFVEAPSTGNYVFQTNSDDGVRVWINGTRVINNWTAHAATLNNSPSISLTAGQRVSVTIEYQEFTGSAVMQFRWRVPGSSSFVAVPASRLYR